MRLEEELKTDKFESAHQRAWLSILFTGNWLEERINGSLKPFGISDQQYNVLRILKGQMGKAVNLYMIQERMIHRSSNATRLVEKLRQKGLVKREICPHNRRMVEIQITEKGLKLLESIEPILKNDRKDTEKKWTKEEAELIGNLLDKLRA
ncbi:MarR family transcriptional regulator [soil metagenome]